MPCCARNTALAQNARTQSYVLRSLQRCTEIAPVLAGLSRKGMIGTLSGHKDHADRAAGSAAAALIVVQNGVPSCACTTSRSRAMRWPCGTQSDLCHPRRQKRMEPSKKSLWDDD